MLLVYSVYEGWVIYEYDTTTNSAPLGLDTAVNAQQKCSHNKTTKHSHDSRRGGGVGGWVGRLTRLKRRCTTTSGSRGAGPPSLKGA